MPVWTLAKKELRLLLRDRRTMVILLAMPLLFILILGLSLGEGFGQKPDNRLRVSIVDLDQGYTDPDEKPKAGTERFPTEPWARIVRSDLEQTGGIRVEVIGSREEAERLVHAGKRAAVLVLGATFSEKVYHCSFLAGGTNPFYRDGVDMKALDAELIRDPTQITAAAISEQVAQVSLLRVILPWMIGRAFEKLGEPKFMTMLADEVPAVRLLPQPIRDALGPGVQRSLKHLFPKYNLTAKTWASLTQSEPKNGQHDQAVEFVDEGGSGLLKRGAANYQRLVPSYTVLFAFFLVLTVGWLFVLERRQGTMKRLRAAPLSRLEILAGKLLPCFLLSVSQGVFLLACGKLLFGMRWGPESWSLARQIIWLLPLILTTSLAAMGLAMLIAAWARTETQVAVYGTLLVIILSVISGCMMGDRDLMPQAMQELSRFTPQAWALDAYKQLLTTQEPNLYLVGESFGILAGFGVVFLALAWWLLKLE